MPKEFSAAFSKTIRLGSGKGAEARALEVLEELRVFFGLSSEALADFRVAVVEACLNALEHGGPPVAATVEGQKDGEVVTVRVVVRDHGGGFSPQAIPQPELPAKLQSERKRGWGLAMMQRFADRLEITSKPGLTEVRLWRIIRHR